MQPEISLASNFCGYAAKWIQLLITLLTAAYPTREDLNTMRADQAGVIVNRGLMGTQENTWQVQSTLN